MTDTDLPITSDDVLEWSRRALPGTDVDVRYLLEHSAARTFQRRFRAGVLLEATFTTECAALAQLESNPMHVDTYLDGVPLYDRDGALARPEAVR